MLNTVWEFFRAVLLSPWMTGYVVPAVLGAWLALITANIIYIRDTKARVMSELVQLHLRLGDLDFETHRELDAKTTLLYQALLLLGEELTRRGFFTYVAYLHKTYHEHAALVLESIKKVLAERLPQMSHDQRLAFAQNPGEAHLPEGFAKAVRDEIRLGLTSRIDNDVNRFYVIRSDLIAVLGLPTLAGIIERNRLQHAQSKGGPTARSTPGSTSPMPPLEKG